ncbi:hypothetical protein D770_09110 [Flammeovirgaceae bacterium 311]|nr:hypothetical protein D770_09110 [Flammeovirgaceae bacterium 311]
MKVIKKIAPLTLLCALAFSSCEDDTATPIGQNVTFKSLGLDGRIVHELDLVENKLWASTDAGLFVKDLGTNADWTARGLSQKNVKTFIALEDNLFLASATDVNQEEFLIFKSTDGGQSWLELQSNWGGATPEPLNDFAWDAATNTLYACGAGVVATSEDYGETWTPSTGEWQSMASGLAFVSLNPKNGDVWSGGQNAIEGFMLHRQDKTSGEWQSWTNLLPSPSVGKSIAFSESDPQTILVGGEDGIIKTTNNGSSWNRVKEDHTARFYFGLTFDQQVEERVYAASWDKNFQDPQPLILLISNNSGNSWKEYRHAPAQLFGGVWSMIQKSDGNKTRLYLGLYKGGVYEAVIEEMAATE